ncbi:MAG: hypothetical protein KGL39_10140 [Patescibacteria group bacterium]|nr:hypothetical protein [Patescibacteria group bacterium]
MAASGAVPTNLTLYDLTILQRNDRYTGLIEDVTTLPREYDTIPAVPREGWWYDIVKRVQYPTAQFRQVNGGVSASRSIYKKEVKQMLFIDTQLVIDEAIWDADDASVGSVWMLEAKGAMEAASILIGQQTYYGTSADSNGFVGLRSQFAGVVKAGGTTNTTSAYLVWADEKEGIRYDVGKNGSFSISTPFRQQVSNPSGGSGNIFAYVGNLKGYVGLFIGSNLTVWGITGIGTTLSTPGTNPITDAAAQQLVGQIPIKRRNKMTWYMNRTANALLQQNRNAVTAATGIAQYQPSDTAGRPAYAPIPDYLASYKIEVTDSILNSETNS